ncbi:MAG TPA: PBP1A family penicillin-binding protein [Pyrinomonadaceae bacterium]|nr:PBP1A family penicillin-binding protein [Pyrinomonadaceae bacterium]
MPNRIEAISAKPKSAIKYPANAVRPVKSFRQKPPGLFRRIFRFIFNPITISVSLLLLLGIFLTFTYFWFEFSDRIDLLLRGEVFTRTAGIYSAPKNLRSGENISLEETVNYLKSAGYIEKNRPADSSRSRYQVGDNSIEIEPGKTALIDGKKNFHSLSVKFKRDGKSVASINDRDTKEEVKKVQLEPKILSSIAAEGDGGKRKTVAFNDLPQHLVKAITVTEDRAFFEHYGVNFRGIARALWRRYEGDETSPIARQGGSSITQQLVKNLLLSNEPTIERKMKEAYMSVILETRLTKEEIFTLYANQIYLGQQVGGTSIYGVGEAANSYFGKDVSALTLPEAALIAGIIRSPNRYNPRKNLEKVTERRNQVLDSMLEVGEISSEQLVAAKNTPLVLHEVSPRKESQGIPYFSQYAVEELPKIISDPEAMQHLRVYTSIDPDLQRAAFDAVNKRLERLDKYFPKKQKGNLQAALVAIRPKTGEIVAMVGGRNYLENQFNRATDALRQPGSVFKPFVYAAAINSAYDSNAQIFTAASILKDEKKIFTFGSDTYSPNNYGDTFSNKELTLREALYKSKNVITVDLGMQMNIGRVMNLANKAGLPKVKKAYPSMALGTSEVTPLQMATAYTVFANLGDKVSPMPISRVTNGDGTTVVAPVAERKNVLHADVAYIMDDMMKDVINKGTATAAQAWGFKNVEGKTGFAGKTGTSRDGWFAGFTPELVCVVYVGFDDGDDLGMKGSDSAMPIWADFMREALNEHPEWNGDWQMPDSIRKAEIDTRNGKLIRELTDAEAESVKAQQSAFKNNTNTNLSSQIPPAAPDTENIYVSDVPAEFRRVELFVVGTVPNKILLPTDELVTDSSETITLTPSPANTPVATWQDAQQNPNDNQSNSATEDDDFEERGFQRNITVMICPLTGMRATFNCPEKRPQTFKQSEEPNEFCTFHVYPPK